MDHLTETDSPTHLCLGFSNGDTVDLEMKEIGRRQISSRELSNSHFPPFFSCASDLLNPLSRLLE